MNEKTVARLLLLNRQFYAAFAGPFSRSRPASDPLLASIIPAIPPQARVLDVGCGNGRLALLLEEERPGTHYVGVDATAAMLEQARQAAGPLRRITTSFHLLDVTQRGWGDHLPLSTFDCAVVVALLHHIPSFDLRARLLQEIAALLEPAGRLILSTWQFLTSPRLRERIAPWNEVGIAEEDLETGDYLLEWRRGGRGLRYCHLIDREELGRLARVAGLTLQKTFPVGGRRGDLNLVAVLRPAMGK